MRNKKDTRTKGEKVRDACRARYGPDYYHKLGKQGGNPVLMGIKNGTLKVVPVR